MRESPAAPPSPPSPRLIVVSGPAQGRVLPLGGGKSVSIGRHSDNLLQLKQASVSRRHCQVEESGPAQFVLRDLGSLRGSFVNGVAVRERILQDGDSIQVGDSLLLFLVEDREAAPAPVDAVRVIDAVPTAENTVEISATEALRLHRPEAAAGREASEPTQRQLRVLLQMADAFLKAEGTRPLAEQVCELIQGAVRADRLAILLLKGDELVPEHRLDRSRGEHGVSISRTLARRVLADRVAVLSRAAEPGAEWRGVESMFHPLVSSLVCAPLVAGNRALGLLYADTLGPQHSLDRAALEFISAVATLSAPAFASAQRLERLETENRRLQAAELQHDLVGESPAIARVVERIAKVAPSDLSVLILGESGTGKDLVARAIHRNSPRAGRPFVAVNCATLSENFLESELFGHERGAFTGAVTRRSGKFELASGGSLFLDEVGEIPLPLQAKLLRALETREFERLGGSQVLSSDVRVIAATNRDLEQEIAAGRFRLDLYHRLNVFSLALPPLRARGDDISLLANQFAHRAAERLARPFEGFSKKAQACLRSYEWPGNVRELHHAVERAVLLAEAGLIQPEDLPEALLESTKDVEEVADSYHAQLNEAKRRIVLSAMEREGGNVTKAARLLEVSRTYLHHLIKNLRLES